MTRGRYLKFKGTIKKVMDDNGIKRWWEWYDEVDHIAKVTFEYYDHKTTVEFHDNHADDSDLEVYLRYQVKYRKEIIDLDIWISDYVLKCEQEDDVLGGRIIF